MQFELLIVALFIRVRFGASWAAELAASCLRVLLLLLLPLRLLAYLAALFISICASSAPVEREAPAGRRWRRRQRRKVMKGVNAKRGGGNNNNNNRYSRWQ